MVQLWIPDSAKPAFLCRICKAQFTERERARWIRHVDRCAAEHEAELVAAREPIREWNRHADPEWAAYNEDLKARGVDPMSQFGRKKSAKRLRES